MAYYQFLNCKCQNYIYPGTLAPKITGTSNNKLWLTRLTRWRVRQQPGNNTKWKAFPNTLNSVFPGTAPCHKTPLHSNSPAHSDTLLCWRLRKFNLMKCSQVLKSLLSGSMNGWKGSSGVSATIGLANLWPNTPPWNFGRWPNVSPTYLGINLNKNFKHYCSFIAVLWPSCKHWQTKRDTATRVPKYSRRSLGGARHRMAFQKDILSISTKLSFQNFFFRSFKFFITEISISKCIDCSTPTSFQAHKKKTLITQVNQRN